MQLILGDDRLDPWDLRHLMPLGLRIGPLQRVLTVKALHGLDRDDHVHRLYRQQRPCLPLMAGLPARSTATRLAARPCRRLGRLRRGQLGGVARVAPQPLGQLLELRLQLRDFCPQLGEHRCLRQDHLLHYWRRAFPYLWWQGGMSVHRALTLPAGAWRNKNFFPQPRERLRKFLLQSISRVHSESQQPLLPIPELYIIAHDAPLPGRARRITVSHEAQRRLER